jgi:hypothetical protein
VHHATLTLQGHLCKDGCCQAVLCTVAWSNLLELHGRYLI